MLVLEKLVWRQYTGMTNPRVGLRWLQRLKQICAEPLFLSQKRYKEALLAGWSPLQNRTRVEASFSEFCCFTPKGELVPEWFLIAVIVSLFGGLSQWTHFKKAGGRDKNEGSGNLQSSHSCTTGICTNEPPKMHSQNFTSLFFGKEKRATSRQVRFGGDKRA